MRESAQAKAQRYLCEHRLRILAADEGAGTFSGECRGNGRIYIVSHDENGWGPAPVPAGQRTAATSFAPRL
jgi:hypothetical protein